MPFIFGIVLVVLDIWALLNIIGSNESILSKLLWGILILILPVVGLIIWYLLGPKRA